MCFGPAPGEAIVEALIAEAMADTAQAGLLESRVRTAATVSGTVKGLMTTRALVRLDSGDIAAVREELVAGGTPIERLLAEGQRVVGRLDADDHILDVSDMLQEPSAALADLQVGDVVPVRAVRVSAKNVLVELFPTVRVEIPVAQITGNPLDRADDLVNESEVVAVRVERAAKPYILSMLDVDDDAPVRPAPSLIAGGPPWLDITPTIRVDVEPVEPEPIVVVDEIEPAAAEPSAKLAPDAVPAKPAAPRPDPRMLDPRRRDQPQAPLPRPGPSPRSTPAPAAREVIAMRQEIAQLNAQLEMAERQRAKDQAAIERLRTERRRDRVALDKAKRQRATAEGHGFADPELQLRHDVYLAWVARIPAGEKADRPLPDDWVIGPDFIDALQDMSPEVQAKVPGVVMEVLTGLADDLDGRDVHRLRTGAGGDDPPVERAPGEFCFRAAVQRSTASAARLHCWKLRSRIELSRVVRHDDMTP